MAFSTIQELTAYINTTIKTNGIKSITGDQMNAVLIGILQFINEAGPGTVTSITAGAGLSGGTITGSGTISMPNVIAAGTYGSASVVPVFTTDNQGRVTSVTNTPIDASSGTTAYVVSSYTNTSTAASQVVVTGLAFTPSFAIAIPQDTYSSNMMYSSRTASYVLGSGTVTLNFTTTLTGGTLNFKIISFP